MELFDKTFGAIERKLDLHLKRHSVLTSNVANAETPQFRAKEVDFAGELRKAMGVAEDPLLKTNPGHQDISSAQSHFITFDNSGAVKADGNNVDLDLNMGKISANGSEYSKAIDLLGMKVSFIRTAVQGRGGQ